MLGEVNEETKTWEEFEESMEEDLLSGSEQEFEEEEKETQLIDTMKMKEDEDDLEPAPD